MPDSGTSVGKGFAISVPMLAVVPSCPYWLLPQHATSSVFNKAHVWKCPASTYFAVAPAGRPVTTIAVGFNVAVPLLIAVPSWP